jgi:hypothetical protein
MATKRHWRHSAAEPQWNTGNREKNERQKNGILLYFSVSHFSVCMCSGVASAPHSTENSVLEAVRDLCPDSLGAVIVAGGVGLVERFVVKDGGAGTFQEGGAEADAEGISFLVGHGAL